MHFLSSFQNVQVNNEQRTILSSLHQCHRVCSISSESWVEAKGLKIHVNLQYSSSDSRYAQFYFPTNHFLSLLSFRLLFYIPALTIYIFTLLLTDILFSSINNLLIAGLFSDTSQATECETVDCTLLSEVPKIAAEHSLHLTDLRGGATHQFRKAQERNALNTDRGY